MDLLIIMHTLTILDKLSFAGIFDVSCTSLTVSCHIDAVLLNCNKSIKLFNNNKNSMNRFSNLVTFNFIQHTELGSLCRPTHRRCH